MFKSCTAFKVGSLGSRKYKLGSLGTQHRGSEAVSVAGILTSDWVMSYLLNYSAVELLKYTLLDQCDLVCVAPIQSSHPFRQTPEWGW